MQRGAAGGEKDFGSPVPQQGGSNKLLLCGCGVLGVVVGPRNKAVGLGGDELCCVGSDAKVGKAEQDSACLLSTAFRGQVGGMDLQGFSIKKGPKKITWKHREIGGFQHLQNSGCFVL